MCCAIPIRDGLLRWSATPTISSQYSKVTKVYGFAAMQLKAWVTTGEEIQATHAGFFPFPQNADVSQHHLCKSGRQCCRLCSEHGRWYSYEDRFRSCQCQKRPGCLQLDICAWNLPTTSVSIVSTKQVEHPCSRASSRWICILVSASSWLHGSMEWLVSVLTTVMPDVMKTSLPSGQAVNAIVPENKVNSSCLFIGSRRKSD